MSNSSIFNGAKYGVYANSISDVTIAHTSSIPDITINDGSMNVDVPLVVNGRDVMREIDEMRDALLLLKRDVDMEAKYPKLRELKNAYEAELEKYKTFEALK